ncbi:MAG TPA: PAS domain S-box protein [Nitrospirota bacterium]|nr:PAS domain S-box protein [Nitrospirota bacterium]
MVKKEYINDKITGLMQYWVGWALFFAAVFFVALSIMDYVATPKNFAHFFKLRLLGAAILTIIYIINRKKANRKYQLFLTYFAVTISACIIEYMILRLGGHSSTYYAGFFLVIMFVVGFIPLNLNHSIYLSILAFTLYLLPILALDRSLDLRYFSMPLSFLLATFSISIFWRYLSQKRLINELSLQYDLEQQNKQLEVYSYQLKGMVEDRTKELHESEQWHRSLFENATDGIIVLNRKGIIVNANQRACEMHGFSREALVGANIQLLEAAENKEEMISRMQRIIAGEPMVFEAVHNRKDGSPVNLEISAKAIVIGNEVFVQSFYRDITEKKKVHEHLFQSQKLESIGVLAGGVAHDFNNILTAILGYTEIIRKNTEGNEKVSRSLNVIETAARKSGRMISQLLDFSRKKTQESVPFSINDVVQDTVRLLERVIGKNVSISELLENDLPSVRGDVNQLEQVLMNLIVNARDAMPGGGRILISTRTVEAGRGETDVPPFIKKGRYALLSVADTGAGIPPEIKDKIFEPFFTTKERGKGTGLGLSMAYGVVREHDGYITVQSELNKGTTFSIFLPIFEKAALPETRKTPSLFEGKEVILVVDDDEAVLHFIRESLEIYGYRVFSANDPHRAIEIYKREHREIDLVITDVAMPTMSGKELVQEMRKINPAARILEISAYGSVVKPAERGPASPDAFVQKPFETHTLATAVRKILDAEPGAFIHN